MKDLVPDCIGREERKGQRRQNSRQPERSTDLSDGSEVVDKVGLSHSNSGVPDGEGLLLLVGSDSDVEVLEGSDAEESASSST